LVAGAILLGITYGLVAHGSGGVSEAKQFFVASSGPSVSLPAIPTGARPSGAAGGALLYSRPSSGTAIPLQAYAGKVNQSFRRASAKQIQQVTRKAEVALVKQHSNDLNSLLTESGIALGIMAIVSIGLGWLIAGRALRPVRTMSARARGISERNLHQRLALKGPEDELKELGDTFDQLLGRLETAFESQRRFVSNASHELRTPITLERTLVELALADPDPSVESLKDTCRRVLAAGQQQERLIEALLTLARSQRGLDAHEQLDLSEVAADVIRGIDPGDVRVEPSLDEAETSGDPRLIERLIANLLENAIKYNDEEHGWVRVSTGVRDGKPTIEVTNTGPVIEAGEVTGLLEPFRRLDGDRAAPPEPVGRRGLGLGLSIVRAIADAHGARLTLAPRAEGGLRVEVGFPARAIQPVAAPDLVRPPVRV
jgi:signal transduction histidine kinase